MNEPASPRPARARSSTVARALETVAGAALVLDGELKIVDATPAAAGLLGSELPPGAFVVKLLCGQAAERPVAEALAAGRPVTAMVPRPGPGGQLREIRVRTVPLSPLGRDGWLVLLDELPGAVEGPHGAVSFHGLWSRSPLMKQLFHRIAKAARSDATVLVRGDTGTGKELVAGAVHAASRRSKGPFLALNCAALPPTLLESELFGHVRGAFTGAVRDMPGHVRAAHGGTLFLDEVAELPLELQAKLLRVLETRSVLPVGGTSPVTVDTRIVAATHRSLRQEVEAGRFRADLMYRLRVIPLFLPPLRARPEDIDLLALRFVEEQNAKTTDRHVERMSPGARAALQAHDWPGNVRELRNAIEYAFVMGEGPVLLDAELPPELLGGRDVDADALPLRNLPEPVASHAASTNDEREIERIERALERAAGHRAAAAKMLGWSRATLWRRMKALGLVDHD
ncbi:MAG: sigma 54-interacting transcriptional regulator [Myxococcales bacterium]|nr:sigma 54-interacting transcriptional regulator [Myxococcales bacterium]